LQLRETKEQHALAEEERRRLAVQVGGALVLLTV
jgi:hypothetical protein